MTTLSNLKNILTSNQEDLQKETQLKNAMIAADDLPADIESFYGPKNISDMYAGAVSEPGILGSPNSEGGELTGAERTSSRVLEIRTRQRACSDIGEKVRESADTLTKIVSQAECLKTYLEKTEADLSHMEELESKLAKLSSKSAELAEKSNGMKVTISVQKKQLSALETEKIADRDTMEEMNAEILRLLDKNADQEANIGDLNAGLAELQNEKLDLLERIDAHNAERDRYHADCARAESDLREAEDAIEQREMVIAKRELVIADLKELNDLNAVSMADAEVRCAALDSNNIDLKARLSQNLLEMESARKDFEERLRLRDMRVVEFESKFGIRSRESASSGGTEVDCENDLPFIRKTNAEEASEKLNDFSELVEKRTRESGRADSRKRVA